MRTSPPEPYAPDLSPTNGILGASPHRLSWAPPSSSRLRLSQRFLLNFQVNLTLFSSYTTVYYIYALIVQKHIYARSGNPTRDVLEEVVASLEKAKHGLCYSTGLGSVNTVIHLLHAGDHLISMRDVYGGVYRMFEQVLPNTGIDVEFVDLLDPTILNKKIKNNTKVKKILNRKLPKNLPPQIFPKFSW